MVVGPFLFLALALYRAYKREVGKKSEKNTKGKMHFCYMMFIFIDRTFPDRFCDKGKMTLLSHAELISKIAFFSRKKCKGKSALL